MRHPKFGSLPKGERLSRIQNSSNFKNGQFQNQLSTPSLAEDVTVWKVIGDMFTGRSKESKPKKPIPSIKTDLHHIAISENCIVWFGHSSYFLQVDKKRFLVDPVFSGSVSPIKGTAKSFPGSDIYSSNDIPEIDYLVLTHDHWDHLDYKTVLALKPKVKKIITGLGTAQHLEHWGFSISTIIELDWFEESDLTDGFKIFSEPSRHFSGRGFKRNNSLWMSFMLYTPTMKIYLGGDSGYDSHFKKIGEKHGEIDLAILECGQYNYNWKYIHMMPEEVAQAAKDLNAKMLLPVHWSKFVLSLHSWNESIIRVIAAASKLDVPILHPMIGQKVNLNNPEEQNVWWNF